MSAACPVTITEKRVPCALPAGHDGQHKGGGWVWWHGNGEGCPEDCRTCAKTHAPMPCRITADGWCAEHSSADGPQFCEAVSS